MLGSSRRLLLPPPAKLISATASVSFCRTNVLLVTAPVPQTVKVNCGFDTEAKRWQISAKGEEPGRGLLRLRGTRCTAPPGSTGSARRCLTWRKTPTLPRLSLVPSVFPAFPQIVAEFIHAVFYLADMVRPISYSALADLLPG